MNDARSSAHVAPVETMGLIGDQPGDRDVQYHSLMCRRMDVSCLLAVPGVTFVSHYYMYVEHILKWLYKLAVQCRTSAVIGSNKNEHDT